MGDSSKRMAQKDADQAIREAYNDANTTLGVDGFLVGLVGRRVDIATSTTTSAGDTQTFTFSENGTQLYILKLIYTDGTQTTLMSAERTA